MRPAWPPGILHTMERHQTLRAHRCCGHLVAERLAHSSMQQSSPARFAWEREGTKTQASWDVDHGSEHASHQSIDHGYVAQNSTLTARAMQ